MSRDFWEAKLFLCGIFFVCFGFFRLAYLLWITH